MAKKTAGVSSATADRALNERAGVSAANRQRPMRAVRNLGYLPSGGLVAPPSKPARWQFLIPFGQGASMRDVTQSSLQFARDLPLVAHCEVGP